MDHSKQTVLLSVCFITGLWQLVNPSAYHLAAIWAVWLASYRLKLRKTSLLLACLAMFTTGAAYVSLWRDRHRSVPITGHPIAFTATLVEPPDIREDKLLLTVLPSSPSTVFARGGGKLLVSAPRYPLFEYGDQIAVKGSVENPVPLKGFDYPLYLERYGIYGTVAKPKDVSLVARGQGSPGIAALYRLRERLEAVVTFALPEPEAGFLNGILLGSKRSVPEDIQGALRRSGTSHIIAISGANITIVLSLALALLPASTPRIRLGLVVVAGAAISLMTGASASVVRGAEMAILGPYLRVHSRKNTPISLLAFTAGLMLLGNPLLVRADTGFQLSFGAFAGILFFRHYAQTAASRAPLLRKAPETVLSSLAETIAATVGTAPVSLMTFGSTSVLGILANPLILWLLPAITALGLFLIAASPVPGSAALIRLPLWVLLHTVLSLIRSFGSLPFGTISLNHGQ